MEPIAFRENRPTTDPIDDPRSTPPRHTTQDLFVGRWIYLDGMRNGVWTAHSLALAFFFGPTGILSHLVRGDPIEVRPKRMDPCDKSPNPLVTNNHNTKQLTRGVVKVFRWDVQDIMTAGTRDVAPSAAEGTARQMIVDAEKQVGTWLGFWEFGDDLIGGGVDGF